MIIKVRVTSHAKVSAVKISTTRIPKHPNIHSATTLCVFVYSLSQNPSGTSRGNSSYSSSNKLPSWWRQTVVQLKDMLHQALSRHVAGCTISREREREKSYTLNIYREHSIYIYLIPIRYIHPSIHPSIFDQAKQPTPIQIIMGADVLPLEAKHLADF